MAKRLDAAAATEKWASNLLNASARMEASARALTESPGVSANRKKGKFKANLMKAIDDGSWERGNTSYTTQSWADMYIQKGLPGMATAVELAKPKTQNALAQLFAYQTTLSQQIQAMPSDTDAQNEARAVAAIRGMRAYKGKKR